MGIAAQMVRLEGYNRWIASAQLTFFLRYVLCRFTQRPPSSVLSCCTSSNCFLYTSARTNSRIGAKLSFQSTGKVFPITPSGCTSLPVCLRWVQLPTHIAPQIHVTPQMADRWRDIACNLTSIAICPGQNILRKHFQISLTYITVSHIRNFNSIMFEQVFNLQLLRVAFNR